jgi:hypothetical protein
MRAHIELNRRFRNLTTEEREDPALLAELLDREVYRSLGILWDQLLESERVVVLAEAGSGKTWEMRSRVKKLCAEGKAAFFVPIEALDDEDLRDYLASEPGELQRFDEWAKGTQQAWLFLDSVDELKLIGGKLERALGRVATALGQNARRARVMLSCRPSDWRPVQDLDAFKTRLPVSETLPQAMLTGEEAFLAPFRKKARSDDSVNNTADKFRCVVMLPLDQPQIEVFAAAHDVNSPKALVKEIDRHEAWSFARRPLDLEGLIEIWKETGSIGTRRQQHERDVENSLRDDPDRPDQNTVSRDKLTEGVERLALGMMLTKTRTIRAPEQGHKNTDKSSLDAMDVLTDWTDAEVKSLLRRSVFDPATYGRIRFHHRSIQEFLCARRLATLRARGLPKKKLHSLLFASTYGEQVLVPTTRPVAAWLCQEDDDVCCEVLNREPEVLVLYGDPEALPVEVASRLLRTYVAAYGDGSWRGLQMPIAEMQRLARTDLAPTIKALWGQTHSNEEIPEFLLTLVWLGAIQVCADVALEGALDVKFGAYTRIVGIRALLECGRTDLLRQVVDDMLKNPGRWPDRVVAATAPSLFPDILTTMELRHLIRTTPEPKDLTGGFSWSLYNRVDALEFGSESARSMRDMLADLLWEGAQIRGKRYEPASKFSHLTPALAKLCAGQLARSGDVDALLIRGSVIAYLFHDNKARGREDLKALMEFFSRDARLREQAYWCEVTAWEEIEQEPVTLEKAYRIHHDSILSGLIAEDWTWLLGSLRKQEATGRRQVALRLLVELWHRQGKTKRELAILKTAAKSDLRSVLDDLIAPRPPDPAMVRWNKHEKLATQKRAAKQQGIEKSWSEWKRKAEANPKAVFEPKRRVHSISVLLRWLTAAEESHSRLAHQNWRDVRRILGDGIGHGFETALRENWRTELPRVWSRRAPADRGLIFESQNAALTGLAIEASSDVNWAARLTKAHARRAAEWALTELNGLPDWLDDLCRAHPTQVRAALQAELKAELAEIRSTPHLHTLNALRYGSSAARELIVPYLRDSLLQWPQPPRDGSREGNYARNLDLVLSIILMEGKADRAIAELCEQRFLAHPRRMSSITWLQGLTATSLSRGATALRVALAKSPSTRRRGQAVIWFGALFGDRDRHRVQVALDGDASLLMELTSLAYDYVVPRDDVKHDGVFSPGPRDEAESGRNRLLSALIEKPGYQTHRALMALADRPHFSHIRDRLKTLARERAAKDSEMPTYTAAEYREWERRYGIPPRNRDELFLVMLDRLDDIKHDVNHHDFSDRQTLAKITDEAEMQPLLAKKFSDASIGHYKVVREDEVIDKKKTDVRLLASACGERCVVEIKIGDNWTVTELETALSRQLVGLYLRHVSCTAGCLLVTYAGRKRFKEPASSRILSFAEVVARLESYAATLETAEQGRVRLAVVGLDLTPPAQLGVKNRVLAT